MPSDEISKWIQEWRKIEPGTKKPADPTTGLSPDEIAVGWKVAGILKASATPTECARLKELAMHFMAKAGQLGLDASALAAVAANPSTNWPGPGLTVEQWAAADVVIRTIEIAQAQGKPGDAPVVGGRRPDKQRQFIDYLNDQLHVNASNREVSKQVGIARETVRQWRVKLAAHLPKRGLVQVGQKKSPNF